MGVVAPTSFLTDSVEERYNGALIFPTCLDQVTLSVELLRISKIPFMKFHVDFDSQAGVYVLSDAF